MTTIESRTAPPRATPQPDTKTKTEPATRPKTKPTTRPKAEPKVTQVAAARSAGRPRAPFVLLILSLLGGALVSLLLLNTVLARDAYTLTALESNVRKLEQQSRR